MARVYAVNLARVLLFATFGILIAGVGAFVAPAPGGPIVGVLALAGTIYFVVWSRSLNIELLPHGVRYCSIHKDQTIRWDRVERVNYSAVATTVNLIPAGTSYILELHGPDGSMSLSNSLLFQGVTGLPELVQHVLGAIREPLLARLEKSFAAGQEVDFGNIRVSRAGIQVKAGWSKRLISLQEFESSRIESGHVFVFSKTDKKGSGPPLAKVPNGYVLPEFLDRIQKKRA
jgi:hypothetical protein